MMKEKDFEKLHAELDNDTVIFSYGSLLDHAKLRELLKTRKEFKIFEAGNVEETANLAKDNPKDLVILRGVLVENVRVAIITERILRRWYKNRDGELQNLVDVGITTQEIPEAVFLCARPVALSEKGRSLNGGLICNLTKEEILLLDEYEWKPVLKRERVTELKIGGRTFAPEQITFYAGMESFDNITLEEKADRTRLLNLNRKPGQLSPQAKWQRTVRRK